MARITLPTASEPDAAGAAQQLQAVLDDALSVAMLVFGESPGIDGALQIIEEAAEVKPSIRRVVWIRDSAVLSADQRARYARPGAAGVAVDLHGNVAATLSRAEANGDLFVERAFAKAESQ